MQQKKKRGRFSLLIVWIGFIGCVSVYGQQESPMTASPLLKNHASEQDSQTAKALEIALIRLKAAEERNALLEDRLTAKDSIIAAKDGVISVRDEQLKLALEANKDRAAVNTGDARMLQSCEAQLARADLEINRLRYPGLLRSIFDMKTITGAAVGFGIGRVSK